MFPRPGDHLHLTLASGFPVMLWFIFKGIIFNFIEVSEEIVFILQKVTFAERNIVTIIT